MSESNVSDAMSLDKGIIMIRIDRVRVRKPNTLPRQDPNTEDSKERYLLVQKHNLQCICPRQY